MKYNPEKVDEMTLALLYLVTSRTGDTGRAWKGFDRETLARLHRKGLIADPNTRETSLTITAAGMEQAETLFKKHFQRE
ncbi:hypothetical protein JXO52_11055 [bacterium]|nr:hypothetical protein [bacterium]